MGRLQEIHNLDERVNDKDQKKIKDLSMKLMQAEKKNHDWVQKSNEEIKSQRIKTDHILSDKNALIQDLRTQINQKMNEFQQNEAKSLSNKHSIKALQDELVEKSEKFIDLEMQMQKLRYYASTKDAEIEKLKKQINANKHSEEHQLKKLSQSLADNTAQYKNDISALRKSQQGHINRVLSLNDELIKKTTDEHVEFEIIDDLKNQMDKMHANADKLKAKLKKYEVETAALNKKIFKQYSNENTMQQLHKQLDDQTKQCAKLQSLVNEYKENKKLNAIQMEEQMEENELLRATLRSTCNKVCELEDANASNANIMDEEVEFDPKTNTIEFRSSTQLKNCKKALQEKEKKLMSFLIILMTMISAGILCLIANYLDIPLTPRLPPPFDDEFKDFLNVGLTATVQNDVARIKWLKSAHVANERRVHNLHAAMRNNHQFDLMQKQKMETLKDKKIDQLHQIIADSGSSGVALYDRVVCAAKKEDDAIARFRQKFDAMYAYLFPSKLAAEKGIIESQVDGIYQRIQHQRGASFRYLIPSRKRNERGPSLTDYQEMEVEAENDYETSDVVLTVLFGLIAGASVFGLFGRLRVARAEHMSKHWERQKDGRLLSAVG